MKTCMAPGSDRGYCPTCGEVTAERFVQVPVVSPDGSFTHIRVPASSAPIGEAFHCAPTGLAPESARELSSLLARYLDQHAVMTNRAVERARIDREGSAAERKIWQRSDGSQDQRDLQRLCAETEAKIRNLANLASPTNKLSAILSSHKKRQIDQAAWDVVQDARISGDLVEKVMDAVVADMPDDVKDPAAEKAAEIHREAMAMWGSES